MAVCTELCTAPAASGTTGMRGGGRIAMTLKDGYAGGPQCCIPAGDNTCGLVPQGWNVKEIGICPGHIQGVLLTVTVAIQVA